MACAARLALALAVLVGLTSAAEPASAESRVPTIAKALRADHLYVSDSMARVATPAAVARVRAAVRRWREPVFVTWTPTFDDEPGASLPSDLLAQLRDRVARDGLYLLIDERGSTMEVAAVGVRTAGDVGRAAIVGLEDVPHYKPADAQIVYVLDYLRTGRRPDRGAGDRYLERDDRAERNGRIAFGIAAPATLGLLGLRRLRRRWRARAHIPHAAHTPLPPDLEAEAETALQRLTGAVDRTPAPPEATLDALAAARVALDRRHGTQLDALGALVLARAGEAALAGEDRRPCFFHPLHPPAATQVRYARRGETVELPACHACAAAVRGGRNPDALLDRGRPYWERDTVWATTGFGATDPDLARRVLAGRR